MIRKQLLSAAAQCYHLAFAFDGPRPEPIEPGQFLSLLAEDPGGKTYTRAYSVACSPQGAEVSGGFDLCVNRLPGGFFSNLICDLQPGEQVRCHGPHGLFTLRESLTSSLWVASGSGIAPMRGFTQVLFASERSSEERVGHVWLVYEADRGDWFYHDEFLEVAARHANFHYLAVENSGGEKAALLTTLSEVVPQLRRTGAASDAPWAYLCGLAETVKPARAYLLTQEWPKPRILFERYD